MTKIVNGYKIEPGADLSGAILHSADLSGVDFRKAKLVRADLSNANLKNAILREADLSGASLIKADLSNADLRWADLRGADLRGAKHDYSSGQRDLLQMVAVRALADEDSLWMSTWHRCDTTHCIAGWAVTLHPDGKELEQSLGSETAGLLLLGDEAHSHFYDTDDQAKAYLRSVLRASPEGSMLKTIMADRSPGCSVLG